MACKFVWYELMTTDAKAAAAFYSEVVGWRTEEMEPGGYITFHVGAAAGVAGILALSPEMVERGVPNAWIGYIGVDDVDDYAKRVTAAGGAIHNGPADIPGVGRFAIAGDTHDAHFALFKGANAEGPPSGEEAGYTGWHELMAGDGDADLAFYEKLFGWKRTEVHDMGPMGTYRLFAIGDGPDVGGVMTKPDFIPQPHWNYYFRVDDIQAAARRITAAGGTIANGPMEVPGGDWIVQGQDPQGAFFCLTCPPKA